VPRFLDSDHQLVTVHDLKYFKLADSLRGKGRLKRAYIKRAIARSVRVADHVITVSKSTKADIVAEFGVDPSDVSVVPLGPGGGLRAVTGDPPVEGQYVLFVGAVRRHKNVETLVDAYQRYRNRTDAELSLVVAGRTQSGYQPELERAIAEEFRADVHFLGHVSDDTVATLYEHAAVFVFPSLYEGFGLPPLEAMGYGTPVIASDRASIPEVVGDAGMYVDPEDSVDLVTKLATVLENEDIQADLRERGYDRYEEFSWERTASETLDIYREVWS